MRALRVTVSDSEYDALEKAAAAQSRTLEELIRDALTAVRSGFGEARKPLRDLPLLPGHRPLRELPAREDLYEEMFSAGDPGSQP
jgi:hypothetical protein